MTWFLPGGCEKLLMKKTLRQLWLLVMLLILSACSGDPGTGAVAVEWSHDGCKRCNMILNDQFHAAQIRYTPSDAPSEVHLFDDLGCAVIWLEGQSWKDDPSIELWVNESKTGSWIDAQKASYVTGQQTPMQYGLGAQSEATEGSIDFQAAREQIFKVERYFNQHGAR